MKKVDIVPLKGGIDLASTVLKIPPGAALDLVNFEPQLEGGYRRINGYERVDGRSAPSDAVYYSVVVGDSSGIAVGATLTGDSSGATSEVVIKDDDTNTLGVTALSGSYTLSETANGTTIEKTEVQSGQTDNDTDNEWQLAAEDYYRDLIGAVPGSGDVLGAVQYGSKKYAFRSDGSKVKMYESSSSGWTEVTFFDYLFFDAGTMSNGEITSGTTVTGFSSGASMTVKKFIKNAGSYGTDASGYLVGDVTGTFTDNEKLQVGGVDKADADGANVAIELSTTGGRFEFIQHNFYGSSDTRYLYGCDGKNFAWEFDGTVLTPIFLPAPDKNASWNTPKYIQAHKTHLFLSFPGGRLAHSSPGTPTIFNGLMGAAEFGLGADVTGLASRAGDVMAIYTDEIAYGLYGSSSADWELKIISETFGGQDYTVQKIGTVYAVDSKGIAPLDRVQAYGDFESATVSRFVRPILDQYRSNIVGTTIVKERNQYRLFFDDGYCLVMGDDQYLGESLPAFTKIKYPDIPTCLSNAEDDSGNEVILFGDSSGYVYQAEKGYNFDGEAIEFAFRSPFLHQKSPHMRKSYRHLFVDVEAERSFSMAINFELSFGEFYSPTNVQVSADFSGGGGYFDVDSWDEIYWDAETFSSRGVNLAGSGKNISFLFYGNSKYIRPFTIETLEVHYLERRLKSGK